MSFLSVIDEKNQTWIITESDLDPITYEALAGIGMNKSEIRVWREYIYNNFLNNPKPEQSLRDLASVCEKVTGNKILDLEQINTDNELVGHALMVYFTVENLFDKIRRLQEKESA